VRIYWAVDHDIIPLDGANVFQQGGIDSISDRVALAEDPGDFWCLPVGRRMPGSDSRRLAERSALPDQARSPAALASAEPRRAHSLAAF
jgi:hypothetical protein